MDSRVGARYFIPKFMEYLGVTPLHFILENLFYSYKMVSRTTPPAWEHRYGARLHHRMCYVNSTLSLKMIGWVGDKIEDLSLGLFAGADVAGCAQPLRSTSGSHLQSKESIRGSR